MNDSVETVTKFSDYKEGDIVTYGYNKYVITHVSVDASDPNGPRGTAKLTPLNDDGTYDSSTWVNSASHIDDMSVIGNVNTADVVDVSKSSQSTNSVSSNSTTITSSANKSNLTPNFSYTDDGHDYSAGYKDFSNVDFASSNDFAQSWGNLIGNSLNEIPKITSNAGFRALKNVDLDNGFPEIFEQAITEAFENLLSLDSAMLSSLDSLLAADTAVDDFIPGGSKGRSTNDESNTHVTTNSLVDNSIEQMLSYEKISLSDLNSVVNELLKVADENNKTLNELLSDKAYSEIIQKVLLDSQHIPDELKELIYNGEVDISRKILSDIFDGKHPEIMGIDENTILTLKQHLTNVASNNNISLDNLMANEQNSKVIKEALKGFSGVTTTVMNFSENSVINDLMKIYDGDVSDMNSSTIDAFRYHMENVADSNNSSVEGLISSNGYTGEIDKLGRFGIFTNNLSHHSDSSIISILQSMIK